MKHKSIANLTPLIKDVRDRVEELQVSIEAKHGEQKYLDKLITDLFNEVSRIEER